MAVTIAQVCQPRICNDEFLFHRVSDQTKEPKKMATLKTVLGYILDCAEPLESLIQQLEESDEEELQKISEEASKLASILQMNLHSTLRSLFEIVSVLNRNGFVLFGFNYYFRSEDRN